MKNVLFIIPSLSNGGAERVVCNLANSLCSKYNIKVIYFYSTVHECAFNKNVELMNLFNATKEEYNAIKKSKRIKMLKQAIKSFDPNVIFSFLNHVCIYSFLATFNTKYLKRVVFTERINPKYSNQKLVFIKKLLLNTFIKRFVVQNEGEKLFYNKRIQKKTWIIPNQLNNDYFSYKKEYSNELKTFIGIGRLSDQKNFSMLIKAFSKIDKECRLLIYGQGEEKEKLQTLIKNLQLENKVFLMGHKNSIEEIYNEADAFVMPSKFEGMPNALLESLAIGLPCIATDFDFGPREIAKQVKSLIVCDNNEDELTKAMINLINNYNNICEVAYKERSFFKSNFSQERIEKLWIDLIESVDD